MAEQKKNDLVEEADLLKSIGEIEADIVNKAMAESESGTETQTETQTTPEKKDVKKGGDAGKPESKPAPKAEMPAGQAEANGGAAALKPPGEPLAKGFAETATPEAKKTLDVTPFLAAMAEANDSQAAALNVFQKSLSGFADHEQQLAKALVVVGKGIVAAREENAEIKKSLDEIKERLQLPIRREPKSALSKADVAERFEEQPGKVNLSKSQIASVLSDLVIKGEIDDQFAVSAYEGTGWMSAATKLALNGELTKRYGKQA